MNAAQNIDSRALRISRLLKNMSKTFAASAILVGTLVLTGWQFNIELFKRVTTNTVAMNPATAICFISCGIALLLIQEEFKHRRKIKIAAYTFASLVLLIGYCTFL
jgi:hypothetical protein